MEPQAVVDRPSGTVYEARTNHTIQLAKLTAKYAQLHDKMEELIRAANSAEREVAEKRLQAEALGKELAAVGAEIRDGVVTSV